MLIFAAVLTLLVGLMHSVLGGKNLIAPMAQKNDLPIILGDVELTRITLRGGWHMASITWWGIAGVLAYYHFYPDDANAAFLIMTSVVFGIGAVAALLLTKGAHLSWIFFLPVSVITGYVALAG